MKSLAVLIAALSTFPVDAQQLFSVARITLMPVIESDGSHTWAAVMTIDKAVKDPETREQIIISEIGKAMGSHKFCLNGWEITYRNEAAGQITLMGRCR